MKASKLMIEAVKMVETVNTSRLDNRKKLPQERIDEIHHFLLNNVIVEKSDVWLEIPPKYIEDQFNILPGQLHETKSEKHNTRMFLDTSNTFRLYINGN